MKTMAASEAKARFDEVLNEVEGGATVVVTRDGQPVARVSPMDDDRSDVAAAVEELRRYRREHRPTLGGISIRELIEEGRE